MKIGAPVRYQRPGPLTTIDRKDSTMDANTTATMASANQWNFTLDSYLAGMAELEQTVQGAAGEADLEALGERIRKAHHSLIEMPAPSPEALLWKLEQLLGSNDGVTTDLWSVDFVKQTLADARLMLIAPAIQRDARKDAERLAGKVFEQAARTKCLISCIEEQATEIVDTEFDAKRGKERRADAIGRIYVFAGVIQEAADAAQELADKIEASGFNKRGH